jgi:hypothetical protein
MNYITAILFTALIVIAPASFVQNWEVGGMFGGGFTTGLTVTNPSVTQPRGFRTAFHGRRSGPDPKLTLERRAPPTQSTTAISASPAQAHPLLTPSIHYDILVSKRSHRTRIRPFVLLEACAIFEALARKLPTSRSAVALLTKTNQWKPVVTLGSGIKYCLSRRVLLRG